MQDVPTAVRVCSARLLLTRNGKKSGGVDGNGPLRDAQNKQLPPSILQENQLHRESVANARVIKTFRITITGVMLLIPGCTV